MAIKSNRSKNKLVLQEINITPLMDVLTVLLFFLIKIFTVNTMNIDTPDKLSLPSIINKAPPQEAITLVVSTSEVSIDHKILFSLNNGRIPEKEMSQDRLTIPELTKFLKTEKQKRDNLYNSGGDGTQKLELPTGKLLVQADKATNFAVLKLLLNSASLGGYADYQFLGTNENE